MQELIKANNEEIQRLWPSGVNHRGRNLAHYHIHGYDILAFSADHAENIYQQTLIDL